MEDKRTQDSSDNCQARASSVIPVAHSFLEYILAKELELFLKNATSSKGNRTIAVVTEP